MKFFSKFAVLGALFLSACGSEIIDEQSNELSTDESAITVAPAIQCVNDANCGSGLKCVANKCEAVALDPTWGAHNAHWNTYACATCHDFSLYVTDFGETLKIQNPSPGYAFDPSLPVPSYDRVAKTCSNVQCHTTFGTYSYDTWDWGADAPGEPVTYNYADAGKPNWFKKMDCNGCHRPIGANYTWHGYHNATPYCQSCHPTITQDMVTDPVTLKQVAGAPRFLDPNTPIRHFNGVVELAPKYKASCFNCH